MGKREGSCRRAAATAPCASSSAGPDASRPPPNPGASATTSTRKRKAPVAAPKRWKPPDNSTNIIPMYYGHREHTHDLSFFRGQNFSGFGHVVVDLPQPWPMTLVDLHLWILKLFRLHPETQDLSIMGFFKEYTPDIFSDPDFLDQILDWEIRFFTRQILDFLCQ